MLRLVATFPATLQQIEARVKTDIHPEYATDSEVRLRILADELDVARIHTESDHCPSHGQEEAIDRRTRRGASVRSTAQDSLRSVPVGEP